MRTLLSCIFACACCLPAYAADGTDVGLQAMARSHEEIMLCWNPLDGIDCQLLVRAQSGIDHVVAVRFIPIGTVTFRNRGLRAGTTDRYDLRIGQDTTIIPSTPMP